ncbi:MAG: FAD-binding oxidoreductase, partial [Acetomicrobium flavidum]|nr:FAD-binding oxidoreductase [Acetomicrobium flavidum]
MPEEWKNTANVVVIGAGIQGCSIAYNLAKLGMKDVVVLEKDTPTAGSTGRCAAGIRAQWGTKMNCQLGLASLEILENLHEELGMDIGLHQGGYLMVAYKESEFEQLKKNVALQNSLGITSRVVSKEEAYE